VKVEAIATEKTSSRASKAPADPVTIAKRERDAGMRELTDRAHGANVDLGHALVHNLATVDPTDMTVARFFVLCGRPRRTTDENQGSVGDALTEFGSVSDDGSVAEASPRALDRFLCGRFGGHRSPIG
jgi:hypothetical protein